jgi:hypothetical protein
MAAYGMENAVQNGLEEAIANGTLWAFLAPFLLMIIVLGAVLYVYYALVWMTIAKKLKYNKPWIAWIPIVNIFLLPILAKKNWLWGFIFLVPIVNIVFFIMWTWKIYELRKYPGWLSLASLLGIIPILSGFAFIANLIIMGLVAWKDN